MNLLETYIDNPLVSEWFLNLFIRSVLIVLAGWGIIKFSRKQKAPFIGKISLVIMLMLLLTPIVPIMSDMIESNGIENINNQFIIDYEYIEVVADEGPLQHQTDKPINIFFLINIVGFCWIVIFLIKMVLMLSKIYDLNVFKKGLKKIDSQDLKLFIVKGFNIKKPAKIPDIYLSSIVHSPVAFGFFKPIIVIPEKLYNEMDASELKSVIFHEMSHVIRRDHIWGIVQQLLLSFYWWNPFIYRISKEFSIASEYISDNHAIIASSPKLYAKTLVSIIERTGVLSRRPGLSGISSPHVDLKDRVLKIIQKERKMETILKKNLSIMITIVSITIFGILSAQSFIFAKKEKIDNRKNVSKTVEAPAVVIKTDKTDIPDKVSKSDTTKLPVKVSKTNGVSKPQKTKVVTKSKRPDQKVHKVSIREVRRTKYVKPEYPKDAKKARISGIVVLEARVGIDGKVEKCTVKKGHPMLNKAAIESVMQWEYKPYKKEGKLVPIFISVTINFVGKPNEKEEKAQKGQSSKEESRQKPIKISVKQARRIKYVAPLYPDKAKKYRISGIVIIRASCGIDGKVKECKVISGHPLLNQAALKAVKQWEYEPFFMDGEFKPIFFTVTMSFNPNKKLKNKIVKKVELSKKEQNSKEESIQRPIRISVKEARRSIYVRPRYHKLAMKNRVRGSVTLDVSVGIDGKVKNCIVISGHPLLSSSALEAVKRWEYQPYYKDGKIEPVIFYVTMSFRKGDKRLFLLERSKHVLSPMLIKFVPSVYPKAAMKSGIRGPVNFRLTTDLDGNVVKWKIVSGHHLLREAAISAVKQWKYESFKGNKKVNYLHFTANVYF